MKSVGYQCFELVDNKPAHICRVKGCNSHRAKGRRVCYSCHITAWRMNHPLKASYATLRDHAKRRKVKFTLTLKEFEALVVPSGYLTKKGNYADDLHLDRIDPLKGYEAGNLEVLTCSENSAKGAGPDKRIRQEHDHYHEQHIDDTFPDFTLPGDIDAPF